MPLNIVKQTEEYKPENILIMIYGQPGTGKTSFAFTAESPLLLDFDGLAYKSGNRKDFVPIKSWDDVINISPKDIEQYKTIIIDTVGKAQDFCIEYLIKNDPKLKNRNGGLAISGWGALKNEFVGWFKKMNMLGKDVILIGHEKEDKQGETTKKRPDIVGSSNGVVTSSVIMLGYMSFVNKKRVISFNPDDDFFTKNIGTPGVPDIVFENFIEYPDACKNMLESAKNQLGSISNESRGLIDKLEEYKTAINNCESADELNLYRQNMEKPEKKIQKQVSNLFKVKADELDLTFDKEKDEFVSLEEMELENA